MRIKTVPRHRILHNSIKIASATESPSDEESTDAEKNYDSTDAIDGQESYQVNYQYMFYNSCESFRHILHNYEFI